jgi:pseudouridine-5'-phosphate glycosidase
MTKCTFHAAIGLAGVCQAAAVKLAAQYTEFLQKNFQKYLIVCSGVKSILNVKDVIFNTSSNVR